MFFLIHRHPPVSTLFPYTTLFRSVRQLARIGLGERVVVAGLDPERLLQRLRPAARHRSEEHTSELQSRGHLVCRLLLEKKHKLRQDNDMDLVMQRTTV